MIKKGGLFLLLFRLTSLLCTLSSSSFPLICPSSPETLPQLELRKKEEREAAGDGDGDWCREPVK